MKLFFTLFASFMAMTLYAADLKWAMKTDGGNIVLMDNVSHLIYSDGSVDFTVVCNDNSTLGNVKSVSFVKVDPAGIESIKYDDAVYAKVVDQKLTITGCKRGTVASIVSLCGVNMVEVTVSSDKADIDVSRLNSGTYILKVGNTAVKFVKK
ncbi:MAG: T9SS type A sorting domain-containing protein [Prevotella sp.]|nr:T9SS type A sorting domain-containing protein [Prevotella sp.]